MNNVQIIILAAGKGSRMKSDLPKPMHKIAGRTMIEMVIGHAAKISSNITIVYSHFMKPYLDSLLLSSKYKLVLQAEPLGTGHAVYSAIDTIDISTPTIVLYADNPFIDDNMINAMLDAFNETNADMMVMAFERANPEGYGRIVMDKKGFVQKIIECKDANLEEKLITLCNSGIILFNSKVLKESLFDLMESDRSPSNRSLSKLATEEQVIGAHGAQSRSVHSVREDSSTGATQQLPSEVEFQKRSSEYYLTTLLEIAYTKDYKTSYFTVSGAVPLGVNTQAELRTAESLARQNRT